jgi:hypothetical protein
VLKVWGGIRFYDGNYAETIINATHDFNSNFKDPKAAVIVTGEVAIDDLLEIFVVFFFYDGETPPPGIFDAFNALPAIIDNAKVQTYSELVRIVPHSKISQRLIMLSA